MHEIRVHFSECSFSDSVRLREPFFEHTTCWHPPSGTGAHARIPCEHLMLLFSEYNADYENFFSIHGMLALGRDAPPGFAETSAGGLRATGTAPPIGVALTHPTGRRLCTNSVCTFSNARFLTAFDYENLFLNTRHAGIRPGAPRPCTNSVFFFLNTRFLMGV